MTHKDALLPAIHKVDQLNQWFFPNALLNLLASIHFVWFYLSYTPSYLDLRRYELGLEHTPFQHRLLMMFPLAWAHKTSSLIRLAEYLTALSAWFPRGVRPEGLLEAPIDLFCVIVTGLVARAIYLDASNTRLFTPYVYPVTLLMLTVTYSLNTIHRIRFIYDLPSVGFFSIGLYILYFRKSDLLFIGLFVVATINRETTLFLLVLRFLAQGVRGGPRSNKDGAFLQLMQTLKSRSVWIVLLPLAAYWTAWHLWVTRHFAANVSESYSRIWLNVGTVLWPTSWIQILSVFTFCGPLVFFSRRLVTNDLLRIWQLVVPLWIIFMIYYGLLVEIRIFGELIPYIASMAVLIAESHIEALLRER